MSSAPAASTAGGAAAGHVLVLDDDPAGRRLLQIVLTHHGWRVTVADSACAARTRLLAEPPDLVLLDLRLPDGDGVALLQWMRAQPTLQALPALCVSASIAPGERSRLMEAGFDGFVAKPVTPPQRLLQAMAQALAQRRPPA